jgi:hypothetical protein
VKVESAAQFNMASGYFDRNIQGICGDSIVGAQVQKKASFMAEGCR